MNDLRFNVLLMDDNDNVRGYFSRELGRHRFLNVLDAADVDGAKGAVEGLAESGRELHLLITDVSFGEGNYDGFGLISHAMIYHPKVRTLIISGLDEKFVERELRDSGLRNVAFIPRNRRQDELSHIGAIAKIIKDVTGQMRAQRSAFIIDWDTTSFVEKVDGLLRSSFLRPMIARAKTSSDTLRLADEMKPDAIITGLFYATCEDAAGHLKCMLGKSPDSAIVVCGLEDLDDEVRDSLDKVSNIHVLGRSDVNRIAWAIRDTREWNAIDRERAREDARIIDRIMRVAAERRIKHLNPGTKGTIEDTIRSLTSAAECTTSSNEKKVLLAYAHAAARRRVFGK